MILSNITFFGWEFAEKIGFIKPEFIDELWWFAAAIAGLALIVMAAEIVLAVKRYQYEKPFVGNILMAAFSLVFGLWTMVGTNLLVDQFELSADFTNVLEYALFMVGLILFVGYVLYTYFEEIPPICNALLIVTTVFAIAAFVMDTLGAMSLATGAFYMLVYVTMILAVLAILALVRLFITGKSKYVIYLISLVILVGACTFNFCNQKSLFAENALFDYRLAMLVYLLAILVYGLVDTLKKSSEEPVSISEGELAQAETKEELGNAIDVSLPAFEPDLMESEIEVTDLSEQENVTDSEAVTSSEVVELKEEQKKEEKKAPKKPSYSPHYTDFLTELRNRIFFMEQLKQVQSEENYEKNIAVVVFDVDELAKINETHGFSTGDQVLRLAATAISTSFGDVGDCARIDGDGFAVIVKDSKPGIISQRLLVMLEAIKNYNEKADVKVSISFGYAVYSGKGDLNMEALLRMAEKRTEEKRS